MMMIAVGMGVDKWKQRELFYLNAINMGRVRKVERGNKITERWHV